MEVTVDEIVSAMLNLRRLDGGVQVLVQKGAGAVQAERAHSYNQDHPDAKAKTPYSYERLRRAARDRLISGKKPSNVVDDFPVVYVDVLQEALARVALLIRTRPPAARDEPRARTGRASPGLEAVQRLSLRAGLQLDGVRIAARPAGQRETSASACLRLTNARLPFSVRLRYCVFEVPILANSCGLVTLDLSGSALTGIDATFLDCAGSVRLAKVTSLAPLDFNGARIRGYFRADDAVIQPIGQRQPAVAVDGNKGALSLSQATVENEVSLNRAAIWGGVSLKGAVFRRSLSLDDADIRSPAAALERLALGATSSPNSAALRQAFDKLKDGTDRSHHARPALDLKPRRMVGANLHRLLSQSMRARMSSVRADGLEVAGSIFARGLKAHGRLRMKYATIKGGVHLNGARLRSMDAIDRTFELMAQEPRASGQELGAWLRLYRDTFVTACRDEMPEKTEYALDIRETNIGGNFNLSGRYIDPPASGLPVASELDGVFAATRTEVAGKVDLSRLRQSWSVPQPKARDHERAVLDGRKFAVECANMTVKDNFILTRSASVQGVNLENATIEGDLYFGRRFADHSADSGQSQSAQSSGAEGLASYPCSRRAEGLRGEINLKGARIGGDAFLIFSPKFGPNINAQMVRVEGRLDIYPGPEAEPNDPPDRAVLHPEKYWQACKAARDSVNALAKQSRTATPDEWERLIKTTPARHIDLMNGRAAVFCHLAPAWPDATGLMISGFDYERTIDSGPLGPFPGVRIRTRDKPSIALHMGLFLSGLAASYFEAAFWAATLFDVFLLPAQIINVAGAAIPFALAVILTLTGALGLLREFQDPGPHQARPMAVDYLKLQRVFKNQYRRPGHLYWPLGPYETAARALFSSGRSISAGIVELERLREKTHMISRRQDFLARAGMWITDTAAGHGFKISRTINALVLLVLLTGLLARVGQSQKCFWYEAPNGVQAASSKDPHPPFYALAFAADDVVPFLDLKQRERWIVAPPSQRAAKPAWLQPVDRYVETDFCPDGADSFPGWLQILLWGAKVVGWGLTTIILASLATRAERFIARLQD